MQVYLSTPVVRFRETIETADDDDDWMPGNGGPVFRKTTGRDLKLWLGLKLAGTCQSCDDAPSSLHICRPLFSLVLASGSLGGIQRELECWACPCLLGASLCRQRV